MRSDYLPLECWREMYRVMRRENVNALRVSLETGMRIDDVLSLRVDDLKRTKRGNVVHFTAKKTGKQGKAEISADLARELRACAGAVWLFEGKKEGQHRTRQAVYKDVKRAARLLGVEGQISPHSARKTFAVELRKKAGVAEVQKALQHTNAEVTHLYAFADMARQQGAQRDNVALAHMIAELVCEKLAAMSDNKDNAKK